MLPSLYSKSEIQIVTPFEDKLCFLPASSWRLPLLLQPPPTTHVAWPHLERREEDEFKHTEKKEEAVNLYVGLPVYAQAQIFVLLL